MEGDRWLREYVEAIRHDLRDHRKETQDCFRVVTERLADLKNFESEVKATAKANAFWASIVVSGTISIAGVVINIALKRLGLSP